MGTTDHSDPSYSDPLHHLLLSLKHWVPQSCWTQSYDADNKILTLFMWDMGSDTTPICLFKICLNISSYELTKMAAPDSLWEMRIGE